MRLLYAITFVLILQLAPISTASAEIGDVLMSRSYKSVTAGDSWYLSEGYIIKVEEVSVAREQVWVTIWKHGEMLDSQVVHVDETFAYETEIRGDEYTILRMEVGKIETISSNTIVTFESGYQYSDGSNDPKATPTAMATATPAEEDEGVLVEYDKLTLKTGELRDLEDGYALEAKQIAVAEQKVWLILSRYGKEMDDAVLSSGDTYIYTTNKNYLLVEARVDAIYRGTDSNRVQLESVRLYREGAVRYTPTPVRTLATAQRTMADDRADTSTERSEVEDAAPTETPPEEVWRKTFGGADRDAAFSVQQTSNGGYIVAGTTESYGAGSWDVWLVKTDSNGNKVWDRTFGGTSTDGAYSVRQTTDGGYILVGCTYPDGFWLVKTDSEGNKVWDKTFGSTYWYSWYRVDGLVQQTTDGGYILAGKLGDFCLVKTDSEGNSVWNKSFGETDSDVAYSVQQTTDGGYIVTGKLGDFWLVKMDSEGDKVWGKTFGDDSGSALSVQQTTDGGYILAGYTESYGAGDMDVWLIKTDTEGDKVWDKTFGGRRDDRALAVQQTTDGGYILTGYTNSYGADELDVWLIKTDREGNKMWDMTFGGHDSDRAYSVQQTTDGGYILAGYTESYGAGDMDVWLIRLGGIVPSMIAAQSAIESANTFRADTTEAQSLLTHAQTAASSEEYQSAIDYADQAKESAEAAKSAALKQYGIIAAALVVAVIGLSTVSKYRSKRKARTRLDAQSAISNASSNPGFTSATKLGAANSAFRSEKYSEAITLSEAANMIYDKEEKSFNKLNHIRDSGISSGKINAIKSKIRSAEFDEADRMIEEALAKNEFDEHERKVQKAEQSVEEAKNKGVEMPPVVSDLLDKAKGALESHEYQKVGENTAAILTKVGDATDKHDLQKTAVDEINAAKRELTHIEEIGIPSTELREMLDRAEDAYKRGDHRNSYRIAKECIDRSKEKADEHAKARDEIESAKRELARITIVESLMQGLNEQLKGAGDAFQNYEYDEAYTLANDCISDAVSINNKRVESAGAMDSARRELETKEALGIPMHDLNGRLAEAGEAHQSGLYDDALQHARSCVSSAEEAIDLYKPEITLAFPEDMQYNVWRRMKLVLENTGTMHAKNVRLDIKKAFEIRNLEAVPVIEAGTRVELDVVMRPTESGDVPVDYALEFTDPLDRGYKLEDTQWLKVLTEARYSAGTDEGYSTQYGGKVEIRRGYEVLGNNDLRFGIRVINDTGFTIIDVQTILDYPNTLFSLRGEVVQNIGNIGPGGKRTARYELTPLGCVHQEKLNAIVAYQDRTGRKRTVQMLPKEVHCVCPFLRESALTEGEFAELAAASKYIDEGLSFSGIGVSEIADFVKESCVHRLYLIRAHEHDGRVILSLAGESIGEKAYYLLTAVVGEYEGVTQVALRAHSDKTHGLRGFLNEMTGSLRQLVGSIQSAKEIGVIEKKQVINIIDSVVQRTSFGGGRDVEVNVKDSVVHRSGVGGGNER